MLFYKGPPTQGKEAADEERALAERERLDEINGAGLVLNSTTSLQPARATADGSHEAEPAAAHSTPDVHRTVGSSTPDAAPGPAEERARPAVDVAASAAPQASPVRASDGAASDDAAVQSRARRFVIKPSFPWVASRASMLYLAARTHNRAEV